jgi:tetratricopeptide (TPR) repeat protein
MSRAIASFSLHLVRSGAAHNQLASPLTPYVGLCGRFGVSTVHLPWEQRELEREVSRLRYTRAGADVSADERQYTLRRLGEQVGEVLGGLSGLAAELALAEARAGDEGMVHLRLRTWGNELAAVPFEIAVAPAGVPGEGRRVALKSRAPVCLTREVIGAHTVPVVWDRPVRVLYAWAAPADSTVPFEANLDALREAVSQLVPWKSDADERLAELQGVLTVLPFASLEDIERACAERAYTHVYLLAHGVASAAEGQMRYGIALHRRPREPEARVVTGQELAIALGAHRAGGSIRPMPSVVTLAVCDGGAQGSVVAPGGSVAHALHEQGVAWVVASQFPLHFEASVDLARIWMGELLRGTDPRWAVQRLRSALALRYGTTHDWGAILAYAAFPDDFAAQAERFLRRQLKARVRAMEKSAQERAAKDRKNPRLAEFLQGLMARIDEAYTDAERALGVPSQQRFDSGQRDDELRHRQERALRAEFLGLWAAATKRLGLAFEDAGASDRARACFEAALKRYHEAASFEVAQHWPLVQYLSLGVVLGRPPPARVWKAAMSAAITAIEGSDPQEAMWAYGSLAELYLLSSKLPGDDWPFYEQDGGNLRDKLLQAIGELRRRLPPDDPFPLRSTRDQFARYASHWKDAVDPAILAAALTALAADQPGV